MNDKNSVFDSESFGAPVLANDTLCSDVQSSLADFQDQTVNQLFDQEFRPKEQKESSVQKFYNDIWTNRNAWIKITVASACVFAFVTLVFECFLFGVFATKLSYIHQNVDSKYSVDTKVNVVATYLGLYIYAEIYQVVFAIIVSYTRNVFHLFSYVVFLGAMAVYSGIQLNELNETLLFQTTSSSLIESCRAIAICVICISCVLFVVQCGACWKLKDEFKQITGEKIGNRVSLQRANIIFNLHRDAIIICLFFFPAFTLQFVIVALDRNDAEFPITIVCLALSFVLLVVADFCAVREIPTGIITIFVCYLAGVAYLAFKLYRLFTKYQHRPGRKSLIAFDVFTLVLLVWLVVVSVVLVTNFGQGLKEVYASNYRWPGSEKNEEEIPVSKTEVSSFREENAAVDRESIDF